MTRAAVGFGSLPSAQQSEPERFPDIGGHREDYDIVGWDMEPGDVVAFTSRTFHGASGNSRSDRRRRGYSVRYTGDDVRYAPDQFTVASTLNPELKPGDELDSRLFPVVWRDGARRRFYSGNDARLVSLPL